MEQVNCPEGLVRELTAQIQAINARSQAGNSNEGTCEELGLLYMRRCSAFLDLGQSLQAENDALAAIRLLPQIPRARMLLAKCYKMDGHFHRAIEQLKKALKLQEQEMEEQISQEINEIERLVEKQRLNPLMDDTIESNQMRERYIMEMREALFRGLAVWPYKFNDVAGWCLVATEDIPKGTIILEEEPLVSGYSYFNAQMYLKNSTKNENNSDNTQSCLNQILICDYCCKTDCQENTEDRANDWVTCKCGVNFCGCQCQTKAEASYHQLLCLPPSCEIQDESAEALAALKDYLCHFQNFYAGIVLKLFSMFFQKMKFLGNTIHEATNVINSFIRFSKLPISSSEQEKTIMQIIHYFKLIFKQKKGNNNNTNTNNNNDDFVKFINLEKYMELFWAVRLNGFALPVTKNLKIISTNFEAVFQRTSFFNHSCAPSARYEFPYQNHVIRIIANRDIKKGEEVCISYISENDLGQLDRETRREHIMCGYYFDCCCRKCKAGE